MAVLCWVWKREDPAQAAVTVDGPPEAVQALLASQTMRTRRVRHQPSIHSCKMHRLYGNRAVQRLLGLSSIVQRTHITVTGSVTEGKGRDKKRFEKTVVIDTEEANDDVLLARITEARKINPLCIDFMPKKDLQELDTRLQKVAVDKTKEFSSVVRKVRTALQNRQLEEKETKGETLEISEDEPKGEALSPDGPGRVRSRRARCATAGQYVRVHPRHACVARQGRSIGEVCA